MQLKAAGLYHFEVILFNKNDFEEEPYTAYFMFNEEQLNLTTSLMVQGFVMMVFILAVYWPFKTFIDEFGISLVSGGESETSLFSAKSHEGDGYGHSSYADEKALRDVINSDYETTKRMSIKNEQHDGARRRTSTVFGNKARNTRTSQAGMKSSVAGRASRRQIRTNSIFGPIGRISRF